jgi:hypothetical protein
MCGVMPGHWASVTINMKAGSDSSQPFAIHVDGMQVFVQVRQHLERHPS